ncbi:MAG: histidine kinase N-terminal 7TM domain-containing protein [Halobacteriaceae archaeon]
MVLTAGVLGANVCVLLGLAAAGWRNRGEPGAAIFAVLQAGSALWAALTLVGLHVPAGPLRRHLWGITNGVSFVVIVLWLGFILGYTGRDNWLSSWWFRLAAVPLLAGALLYATVPTWPPLVGQVEQTTIQAGTVVQATIGPLGALLGFYIYAVFLLGIALVITTVLASDVLFVGQAVALVVGTLVTVVASVGSIAGVPVRGYPLTQVALGGQSLFWGYAVFRQQFLDAVPGVARIGERSVFTELDDGVLVADTDGAVIRANQRARTYLGVADPVGEQIDALLDRVGAPPVAEAPARFQRQGRTYQVKASTVTNWRGETVGQALVLSDVTGLVRRQQRLQVLNRILRHNVRNDMNVVSGLASQIRARGDEEVGAMAASVVETTTDLVSISQKAIEVEKMLDQPRRSEVVDVPSLVDEVVDAHASAHPAATLSTDVGVDSVRTDRYLFTSVLEEVVENAVTHAGDAPAVAVEVSRDGDRVRATVTDDGPGIPANEVEPIRSGEETDLEHASSLGLWLVYWGTQSLGGEVEIATDGSGSAVTVSVPAEGDSVADDPA